MEVSVMEYKVERVFVHRLARYNTTNYPREKGPVEADVLEALSKDYGTEHTRTNLDRYMHDVNYHVDFTYTFTDVEAAILARYAKVGAFTGKIPKSTPDGPDNADDLQEVARRLNSELGEKISSSQWFFRFSASSPKDGSAKFPVSNTRSVIQQIVTSRRANQSLENGNRILYFVRYRHDWDPNREFRVFVRKGVVTAISQYASNHSYWSEYTDEALGNLAKMITEFCGNIIRRVPFGSLDFTIDVIVNGELTTIELVEINSFGYWMAAGSCLFDWLDDYDKLYGRGNSPAVHLRINMEVYTSHDAFTRNFSLV